MNLPASRVLSEASRTCAAATIFPTCHPQDRTKEADSGVYLLDAKNDLNNVAGNWVIANQDMASALAKFAGYDYHYIIGDEAHNARQGGAILPDVLRWIWRDYPARVKTQVTASKQPLMDVLDPAAP